MEGGSTFEIFYGTPTPINLAGEIDMVEVVAFSQQGGDDTVARFAEIIAEDINSGLINPAHFDQNQAEKGSLRRPGVSAGRYGKLPNS